MNVSHTQGKYVCRCLGCHTMTWSKPPSLKLGQQLEQLPHALQHIEIVYACKMTTISS